MTRGHGDKEAIVKYQAYISLLSTIPPLIANCFVLFPPGDAIYPSLGLGGLPSKPSVSSPTSPWLNNDQVDISHVLPSNIMPVNSIDVEGDKLVCGTDGEAVFVVNGLGLR